MNIISANIELRTSAAESPPALEGRELPQLPPIRGVPQLKAAPSPATVALLDAQAAKDRGVPGAIEEELAARPRMEEGPKIDGAMAVGTGAINDSAYKGVFASLEDRIVKGWPGKTVVGIETSFLESGGVMNPNVINKIIEIARTSAAEAGEVRIRIITTDGQDDIASSALRAFREQGVDAELALAGGQDIDTFMTNEVNTAKESDNRRFVMLVNAKSQYLGFIGDNDAFANEIAQGKKQSKVALRVVGGNLKEGEYAKLCAILSIPIDTAPAMYLYGTMAEFRGIKDLLKTIAIIPVAPVGFEEIVKEYESSLEVERAM
jgi:hypothetical protein